MMLGGSTTSLLSLLHSIDHSRYDIDLLLYRNRGPFLRFLPEQVTLLPQALMNMSDLEKLKVAVLNGSLVKTYMDGIRYYHRITKSEQSAAYMQASFCRKVETEYDIAIGFMELWSDVFVNKYINAKKKISWIHVDYEKAHYIPELDKNTYNESQYIVNVSDECLKNFNISFPFLSHKTICIENILTKHFVSRRLDDSLDQIPDLQLDSSCLNLLSVCRIAIEHKGLDRGLEAISYLVRSGRKIKWYIVGDGQDKKRFLQLIREKEAESYIILLGQMECPFGIYNKFDGFFLPSRFEGKPMTITEAQMLCLPPVVTEYASAREQIIHGETGLIASNDTESLTQLLDALSMNKSTLQDIRNELHSKNFDNIDCIQKFYGII